MSTIQVLSPETSRVIYTLSDATPVFRYELPNVATPMTPHASPYAPYGRYEFGWKHLFCAEQCALADLTTLRDRQGYFEDGAVLRSEILGLLLRRCGPRTVVLADVKFNMTVLGGDRRGGLIIATPAHS